MSKTRRNKGVDALVPDEATPEMLVELLPKAQGILKASASYLALVRRAMDAGLAIETMLSKPLKSREVVMLADLRSSLEGIDQQ